MKFARLSLVLAAAVALSGCSSPDERAHEFGAWASTLKYVASVDASPASGAAGSSGMSAHLAVDGAISDDELIALVDALRDRAESQGISSADINVIVGNAWGFSLDDGGVNVTTINTLRDDQLFVGSTIWYQPLDSSGTHPGGLQGTVGSQAGLRDAPAALVKAYTEAGASIDGVPVAVSTANGKFGITGLGGARPEGAIELWQAISGRVLPLAARAELVDGGPERLEIVVGSADEKATAEGIGEQYPDVVLVVSQ